MGRNELLLVDMTLAIIMTCIAAGTFVISCFGMNLKSGVEDVSDWWFWGVSVGVGLIIIVMTLVLFNYYRLTGTNPVITNMKNQPKKTD